MLVESKGKGRTFARLGARAQILAVVIAGAVVGIGPAFAASGVFTVGRLPVDASAESAAQAREQALADGQKRAFHLLLERLTLGPDRERLKGIDAAGLGALVQGLEIAEEKTSATRYIALLTVHFRPDGVRKLLRDAQIPYSEAASKPVLLLPVLDHGGLKLWEEPNPWRQAWAQAAAQGGLVPIILPLGDLEDTALIDAAGALAGDRERLARVAARYSLEDALVAFAAPPGPGARGPLRVRLLRQGVAEPDLSITINDVSAATFEPALNEAARAIARSLDEKWKRQTLMRFDTVTVLDAVVPAPALAEIIRVRDRLSQAAEINRVDLVSVSRERAHLRLHFYGMPERLQLALKQRDLILERQGDTWLLRMAGIKSPSGAMPTPANALQ
jgi:hypothetical protein